ncbi:copper amine oxidase N-terminal domain-containing protein [Paenibacillus oenotherae]|uniref:Copper amine oxidase N-terminal domain-containing protein n=1 Tax=Paenibacillus oenotherae TaxID=1435645 RepID=A0ABS7D129_9BACL|nr:stalk domain-containing protein [Paenibacillus oenotherae]MBW7473598.1 copper amine oxidase N-terminal domain-containing protein [Paenibacillus oenotherae]
MKFRKLLILLLVMSLWGGTMLFADAAVQKIRVIVNGSELDDAGLFTDGKTYLSIRQIANTMQSIVSWDESSKKVTVYKPNVHMFLFQDNTIFGNVTKGNRISFKVFAQIDNLLTDISAVKVSIFDPDGKEELIQSEKVSNKNDNFWYRTDDINYTFSSSGKYTIRFYMKSNASDDWKLISEKTITAKS